MIAITEAEKKAIAAKFPDVYIARTMRQDSKRHHYYMEERGGPMRMLRAMRGQAEPSSKRRGR